jgi:hypothetical protein
MIERKQAAEASSAAKTKSLVNWMIERKQQAAEAKTKSLVNWMIERTQASRRGKLGC